MEHPKNCLTVFENPSNLFILMELFEEFNHLCYLNKISFWIDWGSELGALRHGNIIPWDIDCDTCLTKDNYEKLLNLFRINNNKIGNLTCDTDGYDDPDGCFWIYNEKYLYLGKDIFGIDCVSYKVEQNQTKTLMSQQIIDLFPVTPASYDYSNDELYPLKQIPFVGNFVFIPHKSIDLMKRAYGNEDYLNYPPEEYKQWLHFNSNKLFLLNSPFKTIPQVQLIEDGLQLNTPFFIKNSTEFNVDLEKLKENFVKETQMTSWYETKEELFVEDISKNCKNLWEQWENNELKTNITDSPLNHYEFLPKSLNDRIDKLDENSRPSALCYVLTNENTLTKFHQDISGGGWVYLKQGTKLWWFISPEDIQYLQKNNYPIESLRELTFTQLVFLHNYYLWGKIYILLLEQNDFVYFPEHWAHRVFTYEKACGLGGYAR